MNIFIREEKVKDYNIVESIIEKAFVEAEHSDNNEHKLVSKLRESHAFVQDLSLVAEIEGEIKGHILMTKALIENGEDSFETLVLAPLSVLPEYQKKGIGSKLIKEAFERAKKLGYTSVIVLGHKNYYPKFGFEKASKYSIEAPFSVPEECFMIAKLQDNALHGVNGVVIYAKEFFNLQ